MNPPNFCCNICSEASMLASNLLQFLGLPRLGVEFGESAPAVRNEMSRKSLPRITRRRFQEFFYI